MGGFPSSDSGLKGVWVLPRGPLKPIITVFCQKLKANQGGGEEGLHLPISQSLRFIPSGGGDSIVARCVCPDKLQR